MGKNPTSQNTMSMDASGLKLKSFSCSTVKNGAQALTLKINLSSGEKNVSRIPFSYNFKPSGWR